MTDKGDLIDGKDPEIISLPEIWYVDDLQSNLDSFKRAHGAAWNVKTFLHPQEVLDKLENRKPAALFVDLFFYDTPKQSEDIESKVTMKAKELKATASEIDAVNDKYLSGLRLINDICDLFEKKFPIYAYTSKGPYLLEGPALHALAKTDIPIVYKGRYSRETERLIVTRDIKEYKKRNSLKAKIARRLWRAIIVGGILSWAIGRLLEYFISRVT
ncbi:MAG: hypothetical protein KJ970_12045 [Candidatus Eisenbacteria bacterium]|uniref:Uncharacterized protein n=1 Tax=Eiseniibacteriota bacterium TaxID=2212470 RepID=A0A948RY08_UNCEI|nr:hypothetical protein [Candidatus Eisenbacteria bacterium]MBU1947554.1 hypothetical protein [Candidatus Eisenbacteria bacterium]MBU2691648.1 hypothetical protein [Candidatus Eisenbacteria bacterium]